MKTVLGTPHGQLNRYTLLPLRALPGARRLIRCLKFWLGLSACCTVSHARPQLFPLLEFPQIHHSVILEAFLHDLKPCLTGLRHQVMMLTDLGSIQAPVKTTTALYLKAL
jgi:hypothetical protein